MVIKKILLAFILFLPIVLQADLIPTGDNPFYYRSGGGQYIPVPAYNGATAIPLGVEGDVGLGYNCGVFNPQLSITNSLNAIKSSFQNVAQNIVANATAAITEFPLYALSRADPDLYNLFNNGLLGARKDLELSTKSCQVMQSEMAQGKNPYTDWAHLSMGNDWKYRMSLASQISSPESNSNNGDLNLVAEQIEKDNGDNGIPWVHGANIGRNGRYAGGRGQPAIIVLHDTSVAGYNIILQINRNYDDESAPIKTDANAHLVETWANPKLAADWITTVLGDEKMTTYVGGDKQSTPGIGLLSLNQQLALQILQQLQKLVSGQTSVTLENLKKISAPGVMINSAVIQAIQQKEPVLQAIVMNKLSQEVATAQLIDKALLARQILQEGSQVPAIYGNKAAQEAIQKALNRLDQAITNLLFNVKVRKALVSETASQLLETTATEQHQRAAIQTGQPHAPALQSGALKNEVHVP